MCPFACWKGSCTEAGGPETECIRMARQKDSLKVRGSHSNIDRERERERELSNTSVPLIQSSNIKASMICSMQLGGYFLSHFSFSPPHWTLELVL